MFAILRSFSIFLLITTFLPMVRTEPLDLKNIPKTEAERGDAFIEAWMALRNDLDSLSRFEVHPALLHRWFEAMPGFLLRDVARLATDPEVIVAAVKRLKDLGGEANERMIEQLIATHDNNQVAYALQSIMERESNSKITTEQVRRTLGRVFPHHYSMFILIEQAVAPLEVEGSMYDTWLRVMGDAVRDGAHSSSDVAAKIKSKMTGEGSEIDTEVLRRHLAALGDFWNQVDDRISNTSEFPSWPKNFAEAMTAIRDSNRDEEQAPRINERRVSAAISLCSSLGKNLGYDKIGFDAGDLSVLTSGAGRAFDGNFATSWHVTKGKALVLINETGLAPKGLWVANFCPENKTSRIASFQITMRNDKSSWVTKAKLKLNTNYFQFIPLTNKMANRIEIEVGAIQGKPPSCIAEIRLEKN